MNSEMIIIMLRKCISSLLAIALIFVAPLSLTHAAGDDLLEISADNFSCTASKSASQNDPNAIFYLSDNGLLKYLLAEVTPEKRGCFIPYFNPNFISQSAPPLFWQELNNTRVNGERSSNYWYYAVYPDSVTEKPSFLCPLGSAASSSSSAGLLSFWNQSTLAEIYEFLRNNKSNLENCVPVSDLVFSAGSTEDGVQVAYFAAYNEKDVQDKRLFKVIISDSERKCEEEQSSSVGIITVKDSHFKPGQLSSEIEMSITIDYSKETKSLLSELNVNGTRLHIAVICSKVIGSQPNMIYLPVNLDNHQGEIAEILLKENIKVDFTNCLGQGSFGTVYGGTDLSNGKNIAIKFITCPNHSEITKEANGNLKAAEAFKDISLKDGVDIDTSDQAQLSVHIVNLSPWTSNVVIACPLKDASMDKIASGTYEPNHLLFHHNLKEFIKNIAMLVRTLHRNGLVYQDLKLENILANRSLSDSQDHDLPKGLAIYDCGTVALSQSSQRPPLDGNVFKPVGRQYRLSENWQKRKEALLAYIDKILEQTTGTPDHMSPEANKASDESSQAKWKRIKDKLNKNQSLYEMEVKFCEEMMSVGRKSDVYSLGLTILEYIAKTAYLEYQMVGNFEELMNAIPDSDDRDSLKDLLVNMLQENPEKRFNIDQVLEHKYLKDVLKVDLSGSSTLEIDEDNEF